MGPSFYRQIQMAFLKSIRICYIINSDILKFCHEGLSLSRVTYKENVLALQRNNEHYPYTITLNRMLLRQVLLLLRTEGKQIKDDLYLLQPLTLLIAFVIVMLLLRILKNKSCEFSSSTK